MFVIGLTGGIGTGKSTVAQVLEEQGAPILNADLVGHEVYLPGRPAFHEIVEAFGQESSPRTGRSTARSWARSSSPTRRTWPGSTPSRTPA